MATVGVVMVLVAHGHYTIDVLIAYYITTRLFWTYHTLTNNAFLIKVSHRSNSSNSYPPIFRTQSHQFHQIIFMRWANFPSCSTIPTLYCFIYSIRLFYFVLFNSNVNSMLVQIIIWHENGGTNHRDTLNRMCAVRFRTNLNGLCHGLDDFNPNSRTVRVNSEPTITMIMLMMTLTKKIAIYTPAC